MSSEAQKEAYEEKAKAQIQEWNAEIDRLKAKAKGAQADARIRYEKEIEDLQSQRDDMQGQLRELQKSGSAAFDDIREGFDRAWDQMSRAMRDAQSRFG